MWWPSNTPGACRLKDSNDGRSCRLSRAPSRAESIEVVAGHDASIGRLPRFAHEHALAVRLVTDWSRTCRYGAGFGVTKPAGI